MNSNRLPSGSRTYRLVPLAAPPSRPPARSVQRRFQRLHRAFPHEAEVTAGRLGGGSTQRERLALPQHGTVKIDLLVPEMDGADPGTFVHLQTEGTIERNHRFRISHRSGDMIEASDTFGPLRQG